MAEVGNRFAATLARLETKKKELEDELGRLARDETEAERAVELALEVEELEQELATARASATKEIDVTKTTTQAELRKQAMANKTRAERQLDDLAKSMLREGETFEAAYDRALDTEMGRAMLKTLDEATAIATGQPTEAEIEAVRRSVGG